ncbi:MAG: AmmeMemoRadiSam system protein A [Minisyncoccia bacterium]
MKNKKEFLSQKEKRILKEIAKKTIEEFIKFKKIPDFNIKNKKLNQPLGAFVTLKKNSNLRGCIGVILSFGKPLWKIVQDMAITSATQDPRFEPIKEEELKELEYEISVIFNFKKIDSIDKIILGKHGVLVVYENYSGVFLPQVAKEENWNLEEFLDNLMLKAGLPEKFWQKEKLDFYTFEAEIF